MKKENFNTLSHHEGMEEEGNMKFSCHFEQIGNDWFGEKNADQIGDPNNFGVWMVINSNYKYERVFIEPVLE